MDLQVEILNLIYPKAGKPWKEILVGRDYWLDGEPLRYAVGQPMGAYSSWGMLALTHHILVQAAHRMSGGTGWFQRYMVLGDDIVIADLRVAKGYTRVMRELGVSISMAKSLRSRNGVFEFAKRLIHPTLGPLHGLPLKAFQALRYDISTMAEVIRMIERPVSAAQVMRLMGFGFRVRGALGTFRGRRSLREIAYSYALMPGVTSQSFQTLLDWWEAGNSRRPIEILRDALLVIFLTKAPLSQKVDTPDLVDLFHLKGSRPLRDDIEALFGSMKIGPTIQAGRDFGDL